MSDSPIPFVDLRAQHDPIRQELLTAIGQVIDQNAFAGGPFVASFEQAYARYCGSSFAMGVGNGTDALWLALLSLGVGPGDEVITVSATFFATAEAISLCGAVPVFVDIDESTYTINPALIEAAITPRTKAIIPVHLYGQMADMDPILAIAKRHGLFVVEDACQAHGAEYRGRKAGTLGDAGCFSFYPTKNLGALGEAGAVVTNNQAVAQSIRVLRDHGQQSKYNHAKLGWNARMDGFQAVALGLKLAKLDEYNRARQRHAERYLERLRGRSGVVLPFKASYAVHVYHLFVVQLGEHRDRVLSELGAAGISTAIHYPIPVHLQQPYRGTTPVSLPVTEKLAKECLSLPLFPELRSEQVDRVVEKLTSILPPARK